MTMAARYGQSRDNVILEYVTLKTSTGTAIKDYFRVKYIIDSLA